MAACIGSCLGSCCASVTMTSCCKACSCKCLLGPKATNGIYVSLLFATSIAALVLQFNEYTLNARHKFDGDDYCEGPDDNCSNGSDAIQYKLCNSPKCAGQFATYRLSFTMMVFFGGMFILTAFPSKFAVWAHHGFWWGKFLFVGAVFTGAIFATDDVFAYYAWIARFISPFFLFYQMVYFIDLGYSKNKQWCDKDDASAPFLCTDNENGNKWKCLLLTLSFGLFSGTITGWALMYKFYPQDTCAFNPLAITTTLIFSLVNTCISISKIAPHGALFTSALIAAYTTYLCWNALSYMPTEDCNPHMGDSTLPHIIIGISIAALTVGYVAFRAGQREQKRGSAADAPAGAHDQLDASSDDDPEPKSLWSYYLIMFIVSVYMAMLITNWGQLTDQDGNASGYTRAGQASAWVSLGSSWMCSLLYFWTLVAPYCLPDRDFGVPGMGDD